MSLFDPRPFLPIPPDIKILPQHGEAWQKKWANWWGGATIASPTTQMVAPASLVLKNVGRMVEDIDALNAYYIQETDWARSWVRKVLGVSDDTPVILDSSGTSAILTVSRIIAHVVLGKVSSLSRSFSILTTDEGGSLVPTTLKGKDPNQVETVMFQPNTALFYQAEPVMPYPDGTQVALNLVSLGNKSNTEIVRAIRCHLLENPGPGLILLPHVSKTGRILPIREVGALVAEHRRRGQQIYYIVDDIQGLGRASFEAIADPVTFCDAYVLGSSKALGGLLIASAVLVRKDLLVRFVERANASADAGAASWFSHFQFDAGLESCFDARLIKPGAISLPETASLRAGLYELYVRGRGETFADRRRFYLDTTMKRRKQLVDALEAIPGVTVLQGTLDQPLVPSIVCARIDGLNISVAAVKEALQSFDPPVTPSAPIGHYLRFDIPEYRSMPSVQVLADALGAVLNR